MPIRSARHPFTLEQIDRAPASAGVYSLILDNAVIYYGHARGGEVTIRSRLASHLAGLEGRCTQGATYFQAEASSAPEAREAELIAEHHRHFGRHPRCNERAG